MSLTQEYIAMPSQDWGRGVVCMTVVSSAGRLKCTCRLDNTLAQRKLPTRFYFWVWLNCLLCGITFIVCLQTGTRLVSIVWSRWISAIQGLLLYWSVYRETVGTFKSVCYIVSVHSLGVSVKQGSTVVTVVVCLTTKDLVSLTVEF